MTQAPFKGGAVPRFLHFTAIAGPRSGQRLEIEAPTAKTLVLIGRNRDSAIFIDSTDVSRRHAEIYQAADGNYYIYDLGSRNGTVVNGQLATQQEPALLAPGSLITVGTSQLLYEGLADPYSSGPVQVGKGATSPKTGTTNPNASPSLLNSEVESLAYLVLQTGQRFLLNQETLTVGRAALNEIMIDAKSISRQHARLQRTVAGYVVADMGSTNKTFVNNQLVEIPVLLRHQDRVRFGEVETQFILEIQPIQKRDNYEPSDYETTNPDLDKLSSGVTRIDIGEEEKAERDPRRPSLEHGETRLNLDIRDVRAVSRPKSTRENTAEPTATPFPNASTPGNAAFAQVVRLEKISKTEVNGRTSQLILRDVNLTLWKGELVAVIGPAGSGKNSLLQVLAALEPADRGLIQILGRTLPTLEITGKKKLNLDDDKDLVHWRNLNIGYLSASYQLNNRLTPLENVMAAIDLATANRDRREQAWERLRTFGLTKPELEKQSTGELAQADRQKVALVRATVSGAPLILLNEPTANLAEDETNFVFDQLKRLARQGRTILVTTQDQFWIRASDRHYEIRNGEIGTNLT